ncbi:hypothetical protein GCM10023329_45800 [Streptomyces sanyensis]|uniref:Uncharacterized protein n=1 Tax=Streptomyces sanyensis TaxID=568869 RepID=A0ABP9B251_9ACTN
MRARAEPWRPPPRVGRDAGRSAPIGIPAKGSTAEPVACDGGRARPGRAAPGPSAGARAVYTALAPCRFGRESYTRVPRPFDRADADLTVPLKPERRMATFLEGRRPERERRPGDRPVGPLVRPPGRGGWR